MNPMPLAWRIEGAAMEPQSPTGTKPIHLILAWGFVSIPLAWGVIQTVLNAMKLFR